MKITDVYSYLIDIIEPFEKGVTYLASLPKEEYPQFKKYSTVPNSKNIFLIDVLDITLKELSDAGIIKKYKTLSTGHLESMSSGKFLYGSLFIVWEENDTLQDFSIDWRNSTK